ncbi:MAG: Dihydrolipoyllysine-residue acetyltransferase component of pyruvate dehydrogenase complex [Chlamydiia bacterium]|nr:Dihydrolipoyllysine-residue acetyltransferase component of pyruvate dehydrogenase complex [Chlamydiia bacterium]
MPTTLTMPKLSPTMEEGTLVKWMKKEGDNVTSGDVLFEVATDKATVEYNAIDDGFLRKILVQEGQNARVNQAVAVFTETKDESIEGYKVEGEEKVEEAVEASDEKSEEAPATKQSSQTSFSQVGFSPAPPIQDYEFKWPRDDVSSKILASPLAKKLAKEKGIDLASVKGSGPNKRVMSRDVDLGQPDAAASFGRRSAPTCTAGAFEEEPLTQMRKIIGERLQASKTFIPHFYVRQTINADNIVDLRVQLKASGIKVTFNDFIVRACAIALKEHPEVNSGFDSVNGKIIRFKTVDISIAVSIESGLITPIIRHADYKNMGELSSEVKVLASKAKEGALQPHEFQGGSFTISNLGMYGIDDFVAVINPPQASILAVGGIIEKPIVKDGEITIGKTLTLTLSSDHRVVDGSDAANFLRTLKKYLENPAILLI